MLVSPQNAVIEALPPSMEILGSGAFGRRLGDEVMRAEPEGWSSALIRRGRETMLLSSPHEGLSLIHI